MECASKFRDCNNFNNTLEYGQVPDKSSVQYDGFFNSYFYPVEKINKNSNKNKAAIDTKISFTKESNFLNQTDTMINDKKAKNEEIYVSILINCLKDGVKEITKPLDVVIALDISGSMSTKLPVASEKTVSLSCLDLAKTAIKALNEKFISIAANKNSANIDIKQSKITTDNPENENLKELENEKINRKNILRHRLGLSTFNYVGQTIFNLTHVEELSESLNKKLEPIKANGGTSLLNGLAQAREIMQKDCRSEAEKKILFMTDMEDTQDPHFIALLREIAQQGISIDVIGIGHKLNLAYSEEIANIRNVSIHSALTQEEMRKILVDDFEFNFFPIAEDFKIEVYSNNLNVLKSYGTGYKMVASEELDNKDVNSELLANQIDTSKSILVYFNLLRSYFKRRFKRVPLFVLQTICNFMKFHKRDVAEFDKLYPSNIQKVKVNNDENDELKLVKGNLILLKTEVADKDLHMKLGRREFAEIVLHYTDCEDKKRKKVHFPVLFDFNKIEKNENLNKNLLNDDSSCLKKRSYLVDAEYQSDAINIGVSLLYTAKFMRKILKEFHKNKNKKNKGFLTKENLKAKRDLLCSFLKSKINHEYKTSIEDDLVKKIDSLLNKIKF